MYSGTPNTMEFHVYVVYNNLRFLDSLDKAIIKDLTVEAKPRLGDLLLWPYLNCYLLLSKYYIVYSFLSQNQTLIIIDFCNCFANLYIIFYKKFNYLNKLNS